MERYRGQWNEQCEGHQRLADRRRGGVRRCQKLADTALHVIRGNRHRERGSRTVISVEEPRYFYESRCQLDTLPWIVSGRALIRVELGFRSPAFRQGRAERCPGECVRTGKQQQQLQIVPGRYVRRLMSNHLPKLVPAARGNDALCRDHLRMPAADNADDRFGGVNDLNAAAVLDQATPGGATRL